MKISFEIIQEEIYELKKRRYSPKTIEIGEETYKEFRWISTLNGYSDANLSITELFGLKLTLIPNARGWIIK